MKTLITTATAIFLALPFAGFSQTNANCSGQLDITYPTGNGSTAAELTISNGTFQSRNTTFCTPQSPNVLTVKSASNGSLTLLQSLNGGATYAPMQTISPSAAGITYTFTLPARTTEAILYRLASTTDCQNPKNITFTLSLAAALQFRSTSTTVCASTPSTLTAVSNLANTNYAFSAPGMPTVVNTTGQLQVSPAATTTYTVTAQTANCGTATQSLTITVPDLALSVDPSSATIPTGSSATLTAVSNITSGVTYSFSSGGAVLQQGPSATLQVTPTQTTTYTVVATTPDGCATTQTATVTVTQPLPVTLTRFSGSRAQGAKAVHLTWATATEQNNAYFGVERSGDSKAFEALAQVAGAGSSTKAQAYSFTDNSPLAGAAYYRLRQTDFDGKATYSPVVFVAAPEQGKEWLVAIAAPRLFSVATGLADGDSDLTVMDVMGRTVYSQAVAPGRAQVMLPVLPEGVYLFRLLTPQGRYTARQLLAGGI